MYEMHAFYFAVLDVKIVCVSHYLVFSLNAVSNYSALIGWDHSLNQSVCILQLLS